MKIENQEPIKIPEKSNSEKEPPKAASPQDRRIHGKVTAILNQAIQNDTSMSSKKISQPEVNDKFITSIESISMLASIQRDPQFNYANFGLLNRLFLEEFVQSPDFMPITYYFSSSGVETFTIDDSAQSIVVSGKTIIMPLGQHEQALSALKQDGWDLTGYQILLADSETWVEFSDFVIAIQAGLPRAKTEIEEEKKPNTKTSQQPAVQHSVPKKPLQTTTSYSRQAQNTQNRKASHEKAVEKEAEKKKLEEEIIQKEHELKRTLERWEQLKNPDKL